MHRYERKDDNKWEISVFPSPVLCPCIHTQLKLFYLNVGGSVHPCFAPLTVSKHSSAVISPTVWEPNLLSEVEVYQVRGEGGGAEKFLCVCVRGRASFVCCRSLSHLPYLWGFDSSLNPSQVKQCVFGLQETPANPTCMCCSWKKRVSGKVWDTSVCLSVNCLICLAVTLNEAVLACGLYKRFHHLEGYKVTTEKLTDYMSGGFYAVQGKARQLYECGEFFTHFLS